jgi:hypothetical protein
MVTGWAEPASFPGIEICEHVCCGGAEARAVFWQTRIETLQPMKDAKDP